MSVSYEVKGQGEPVLLLHSSMGSRKQWAALIELLSPQYQTIAVDLTGYGKTDFPADEENYSLKTESDIIDQALEGAGLAKDETLHIIGHSFGAATGLFWAFHNKERVKSLHIFEPVAFHLLDKTSDAWANVSGVVQNMTEAFEQKDMTKACEQFIDYWSGKGAFASFPSHIQEAMVTQVPKALLDFNALITAETTLQDYASFDFDITLIKGTQSPLSSRTVAKNLKDNLSKVSFHEVECGHMGPITHAKIVNEIFMRKFTS